MSGHNSSGRSREDGAVAFLFVSWCVITTLRAIHTSPPSPLWFAGIIASAACAFGAGIIIGRRRRR